MIKNRRRFSPPHGFGSPKAVTHEAMLAKSLSYIAASDWGNQVLMADNARREGDRPKADALLAAAEAKRVRDVIEWVRRPQEKR